jgi:methionyl-tRNA formyltransferase
MKIAILTMEDPVYTVDFIKSIISARHKDIVSFTIARGNRFTIGDKRSRMAYLFSLLLIMGFPCFFQYVFKTLVYKLRRKVALGADSSLAGFARRHGISVDYTDDPNRQDYLDRLKALAPDVIINQSQFIIKKGLFAAAPMGMLNRHNALLPKNRGRLTPFWVLYKGEKVTGVSIHFVEEGIDSGPIVVQKRFPVEQGETFGSLVQKNYKHAASAMLEALDKLERGDVNYLLNPDSEATYNTVPTLREAWDYRKKRLFRFFI